MTSRRNSVFLAIALAAALSGGCANSATPDAPAEGNAAKTHDHGGWWCGEHGVPEEVCTRCHAELVADFREKGDWCKEHDLPDSQCFVCHPDREAAYAAQYEAKYGKQPPKPSDAAHDHKSES